MMIAQQTGLEPGDFVWTGGDCHIYDNHLEQVREQLTREPYPYPRLSFARTPESIFDYTYEDIVVEDYQHHPTIRPRSRYDPTRADLGRGARRRHRQGRRHAVARAGRPRALPRRDDGDPVIMGRRTWESFPPRFRPSGSPEHRRHAHSLAGRRRERPSRSIRR
jgi:hypothetical protein